MFCFPICCSGDISQNDRRAHMFFCSLRKKFEVQCFRLRRMSNICAPIIVYRLTKFEVMRKTSHTSTAEVSRSFRKTLRFITVVVEFTLLFRVRCLIRLDSSNEKSSFITLHLCTYHLWAEQPFWSRSVLSYGWKEKKLELSLDILSCAQKVHVRTFTSRVAVSSDALSHRERVLRAGRTSSPLCRRNRGTSLQICSKTKVFNIAVRWSCLAPMSLICVLHVHLLFFVGSRTWWHLKVTRGCSWSWASRVNTTLRSDSTRAKLRDVSVG